MMAVLLCAFGLPGAAMAGITQCADAQGNRHYTDQGCYDGRPIERPRPTAGPAAELPPGSLDPVKRLPPMGSVPAPGPETIEPAAAAAPAEPAAEEKAAPELPSEKLRPRKAESGHWLLFGFGFLMSLVAYFWMAITAFRNGSILWGLLLLFLSPVTNLIYLLRNPREAAPSAALMAGGVALMALVYTPAADLMDVHESYLTAREQTTIDQRHPRVSFTSAETVYLKTVLGWDDWSVMAQPHIVTWAWYTGDEMVDSYVTVLEFDEPPYVLEGYYPAAQLGRGQHRVELYVGEELFDTREFEVL
ncbi:hypothetical protein C3942_10205 [Solimonas fluminis]|uniref:DUF4124 domain-containing protein n=1 Tax=Solimonas fluminis TaxID=2086571 RepID=A0A2S5TFK7_9GAMM|nr:DUF4124 domain-containing protein [Solimonas fluminis]PPE73776.1 hypothetical protein C3942_10205 [Solimonas fluminis]